MRSGSYLSAGHEISFESFDPGARGKFPAVLFLHGADGMAWRGEEYTTFAQKLAHNGYRVFLIRYFDRTGTRFADPGTIFQNFLAWKQAIADGVTYAALQRNVDIHRIGVMGVSLGASLALSVAGQDDRVRAVVEMYGALPDILAAFIRRLPPVLILHGALDSIVPVSEAVKLEHFLEQRKVPFEMQVYQGQGHGFDSAATSDAGQRALRFLNRNLKSGKMSG